VKTEGDCSVRCRVYDESLQTQGGSRVSRVTTEIGFYSPEATSNIDPAVEGRAETGTNLSGMQHYMGGSGEPGQEDINAIRGIHRDIAVAVGESYMASGGSAGTLDRLIGAGGGVQDPSTMRLRTRDVTAGSIQLSGVLIVAVSGDVYAARGILTGTTEPFDFNSNPARGPVGNAAVIFGGVMGEALSGGRAQTFDQDYYGTIRFMMQGNTR
jgi:hypothetical protein